MEKVRIYTNEDAKSITVILDDSRTYDTSETKLTLGEAVGLLRRLADAIFKLYGENHA